MSNRGGRFHVKDLGTQEWQDYAACQNHEEKFSRTYKDSPHPLEEKQAKVICRRCPVQMECLDFAMRNKEPYGVWGGLTTKERSRLRRSEAQRKSNGFDVRSR